MGGVHLKQQKFLGPLLKHDNLSSVTTMSRYEKTAETLKFIGSRSCSPPPPEACSAREAGCGQRRAWPGTRSLPGGGGCSLGVFDHPHPHRSAGDHSARSGLPEPGLSASETVARALMLCCSSIGTPIPRPPCALCSKRAAPATVGPLGFFRSLSHTKSSG